MTTIRQVHIINYFLIFAIELKLKRFYLCKHCSDRNDISKFKYYDLKLSFHLDDKYIFSTLGIDFALYGKFRIKHYDKTAINISTLSSGFDSGLIEMFSSTLLTSFGFCTNINSKNQMIKLML